MMTTTVLWFYTLITLLGMILLGIYGVATRSNMIKKIIMLNIVNDAINMIFILIGYRLIHPVYPPIYETVLTLKEFLDTAVDPLPQALVITSVVIGMAINVLLVTFAVQIYRIYGTVDVRDIAHLKRGD
ncbi:Na+/H+ antiporter subunit C [Thermococcus sp. M39]|uniref:sodium:proton antiporter n=1 Tax=Thermococcus sp. M39 TaxID=1638262 RepID=UPI001438FA2A|nr:sodium:proton antiporter [Thermococcus sp. M39]NJE07656.1 Na+/H+ antiporter subunit C [Thermococcus sp. M39]